MRDAVRGLAAGMGTAGLVSAGKLAFVDAIGGPTPFLMYFAAIILGAWYGGILAGLATTSACTVLAYTLFVAPDLASHGGPAASVAQAALFVFEGSVLTLLAGRVQAARAGARRSEAARLRAERDRAFLARVSDELHASLDHRVTLAAVARLAVPALADACAVDLLEVGGLERHAVAHVDPRREEEVRGWPAVSEEVLALPMTMGNVTIGVLLLARTLSGRRHDAEDLALAEALADRAAAALDRARRYQDHMEAWQAVEIAQAEAEIAHRAKDDFLAILGHELRNPLAPIFTALHLLKIRGGTAIEQERLVIERQSRQLVRLVDDLLDISRASRGLVDLALEPVDLREIVLEALETVSPRFLEARHEVVTELAAGLVLNGDRARIGQVVTNLLSNAARYTQAGGRIEVTAERAGEVARLTVRDNGKGISPELLRQIFEPFVQDRQALDRPSGGLGLGLAIARNLVTLHGGRIEATSAGVALGSAFVVELPLAVERDLPEAGPPAPRLPVSGSGARVLVVDDNADARQLLSEALRLDGHEVHTAADGLAALEVAAEVRPHVAFVDIGLPGMDGYEVGRLLRERELAGHPTRLVALTGYGRTEDRARSAAAGFDEHLVKPVAIEEVAEIVARAATGSAVRPSPRA